MGEGMNMCILIKGCSVCGMYSEGIQPLQLLYKVS